MVILLCSAAPQALNQTLLDSGDSAFVFSTYQRKRLYYLLEQQQTRKAARDAVKELERIHWRFRVAVKEKRRFAVRRQVVGAGIQLMVPTGIVAVLVPVHTRACAA